MKDTRVIYSAGWNTAGYSPDPECVVYFATQSGAREYIADEIERAAEWIVGDTLADDAAGMAHDIRTDDGMYSGEFSEFISDGRPLDTVYWVQECTLEDAFDGNTDSFEYRNLTEGMDV